MSKSVETSRESLNLAEKVTHRLIFRAIGKLIRRYTLLLVFFHYSINRIRTEFCSVMYYWIDMRIKCFTSNPRVRNRGHFWVDRSWSSHWNLVSLFFIIDSRLRSVQEHALFCGLVCEIRNRRKIEMKKNYTLYFGFITRYWSSISLSNFFWRLVSASQPNFFSSLSRQPFIW